MGEPRRYLAIIQDARGYSRELEDAPPVGPAPPMVYSVVKADEHDELRRDAEALAEALETIRDACDGDPIAMAAANALITYRAQHPQAKP